MALTYRCYINHDNHWWNVDTEYVSYKLGGTPRVFNEVLAGQLFAAISAHKGFTMDLPTDSDTHVVHTLLRAYGEQWHDLKVQLDLVKVGSAASAKTIFDSVKNSLPPESRREGVVASLLFDKAQITDYYAADFGYAFVFAAPVTGEQEVGES